MAGISSPPRYLLSFSLPRISSGCPQSSDDFDEIEARITKALERLFKKLVVSKPSIQLSIEFSRNTQIPIPTEQAMALSPQHKSLSHQPILCQQNSGYTACQTMEPKRSIIIEADSQQWLCSPCGVEGLDVSTNLCTLAHSIRIEGCYPSLSLLAPNTPAKIHRN